MFACACLWLIAFFFAACALPAGAAVDINDQVDRYGIEGSTPADLRREMDAIVDLAIAALPPAGNCDALGAEANALGMRILQKYQQRDRDYDRDTRYGAAHGARFP